jgi:N-methylhydantoinase A
VRVRSTGLLEPVASPRFRGTTAPPKPSATRDAYFGGRFRKTKVYDGPALRAGQGVDGPAIVEEPFTTVVVPPGWRLKLDRLGNYVGTTGGK